MAVVGLALLFIPLAFSDAEGLAAGTATVVIDGGLTPVELTVSVGTTVTWQGADVAKHRIRSTSGPEQFDSGGFTAGASFSYTFDTVGAVHYRDEENKNVPGYSGSITVVNGTPATTVPPGTTQPGTPGTTPAPQTITVRLANRAFSPSSISIAVGDTVVWTNNDKDDHTVTARGAAFDSGVFAPGGTYRRTFTAAGSYSYFCDLHPNMVGVVAVSAPTSGGTLPPPPPPPTTAPAPPTTQPPAGGSGGTGGNRVTMVDYGFSPAVLTVAQGTQVTWTNGGQARHTVVADDGSFRSADVRAGQQYSRLFSTPGTFTYICDIHPEMKGTIAVTGANGTPPPPPAPTTTAPPVTAGGDVRMVDFGFSPASVTITEGDSLTFVNTGAARHSATARDGSFDTGLLPRGGTSTKHFATAGTYLYFCTLHANMTGTVFVTGANGEAPPPPKSRVVAAAKDGDVQMIDFDFAPKQITVSAGGSVGFVNGGVAPHTATARDGSWDTGMVASGQTVRISFDTPGTFSYYCTIHPQMVATLLVTGADGSAPPPEAAPAAPAGPPTTLEVAVEGDTFEPAAAKIAQGGTVTWVVEGRSPHIIAADDESFTSDLLQSGDTYSHTFDTAGTFTYHDGLTGHATGSITVVPAAGSGGVADDGLTAAVNIIDLDYDPREVTIAEGGEVTWTNTGQAPHTVTEKGQAWTSELLQNGDSYSQVFDTVGRYEYYCTLHPNMVGTVVVTDAAGVAPAAQGPQPAPALVASGTSGRGSTSMVLLAIGGLAVGLGAFVIGRRTVSRVAPSA